MNELKKILDDAKEYGFTLSSEEHELLADAVEKAEKYDKIVHCTSPCKYYYPPVCTFYKWLPMTSRQGYCNHGIKGEYKGGVPIVQDGRIIGFEKYMNPPQEDEDVRSD